MNPKQKTAIIVVALVLVPIILVCCAFALALGCAEFWSSGRFTLIKPWIRRQLAAVRKQLKPIKSDDPPITLVSNINLMRNSRVLCVTRFDFGWSHGRPILLCLTARPWTDIGSSLTTPAALMPLFSTGLASAVAIHYHKPPLRLGYGGLNKSCM
ncbi:hypothetical protein BDW68DRAFT_192864 [Aspergillus falconensis]